jgi:hypothetical protein
MPKSIINLIILYPCSLLINHARPKLGFVTTVNSKANYLILAIFISIADFTMFTNAIIIKTTKFIIIMMIIDY